MKLLQAAKIALVNPADLPSNLLGKPLKFVKHKLGPPKGKLKIRAIPTSKLVSSFKSIIAPPRNIVNKTTLFTVANKLETKPVIKELLSTDDVANKAASTCEEATLDEEAVDVKDVIKIEEEELLEPMQIGRIEKPALIPATKDTIPGDFDVSGAAVSAYIKKAPKQVPRRKSARTTKPKAARKNYSCYNRKTSARLAGKCFQSDPNMYLCLKKYECDVCKKIFREKIFLLHHIRTHYYCCPKCDYWTEFQDRLVEHELTHNEQKGGSRTEGLENPDSSDETENPEGKSKNNFVKPEDRRYQCPKCEFQAETRSALGKHDRVIHKNDFPFHCDQCTSVFKQERNLTIHVEAHHSNMPELCHVCGHVAQNMHALNRHYKVMHEEPHTVCGICNKPFYTERSFEKHQERHKNKEEIKCEVCGRIFKIRYDLLQHMTTHTGAKPYSCKVCGQSFAKRNTIRQHMLIHASKKLYACDICGKEFRQKPGLSGHRKSHNIATGAPSPIICINEVIKELDPDLASDKPGFKSKIC
ncbi:zinc finger protein ZFP2-like [Prorops nasuta]|uniref:zinc finger protein ZFP2-like n=1 Tax=Prorops nasuta TaxID=863751 RepID=UPI0034CF60D0